MTYKNQQGVQNKSNQIYTQVLFFIYGRSAIKYKFLLGVNRTLLENTRKNSVQELIASPACCFVYKKAELRRGK